MSDLIKRLRKSGAVWDDGKGVPTDLEVEAVAALKNAEFACKHNGHYIKQLDARIAELEAALKHYANRKMWQTTVIDSYSGECYLFDWDGDLADEPYGIAEKVLASAGDTGK